MIGNPSTDIPSGETRPHAHTDFPFPVLPAADNSLCRGLAAGIVKDASLDSAPQCPPASSGRGWEAGAALRTPEVSEGPAPAPSTIPWCLRTEEEPLWLSGYQKGQQEGNSLRTAFAEGCVGPEASGGRTGGGGTQPPAHIPWSLPQPLKGTSSLFTSSYRTAGRSPEPPSQIPGP